MRNLKQIEEDLGRLEKEGIRVYFAMVRETFGEEAFRKELEKTEEIDVEDVFKNLPYPAFAYEEWYSQALPAVKDLLPDRYGNIRILIRACRGARNHQRGHIFNPGLFQVDRGSSRRTVHSKPQGCAAPGGEADRYRKISCIAHKKRAFEYKTLGGSRYFRR
jgi:hypothetical protein